jgi:hypothetical protein
MTDLRDALEETLGPYLATAGWSERTIAQVLEGVSARLSEYHRVAIIDAHDDERRRLLAVADWEVTDPRLVEHRKEHHALRCDCPCLYMASLAPSSIATVAVPDDDERRRLLACADVLRFHNRTPSGRTRTCLDGCIACEALAALDAP